jgi:hypothetical protein
LARSAVERVRLPDGTTRVSISIGTAQSPPPASPQSPAGATSPQAPARNERAQPTQAPATPKRQSGGKPSASLDLRAVEAILCAPAAT